MTLVVLLSTVYIVVQFKIYYHTLANTLKILKCGTREKWRSVGNFL